MFLKDFHVFAISLVGSKKHRKIAEKSWEKHLNLQSNFGMQFWSRFGPIWIQFWVHFGSLFDPFWLHVASIWALKVQLEAQEGPK